MDDPREQRYQMVLRRLEDLATTQEEIRQRHEELLVQISEQASARAALAERLEALERAAAFPCVCAREMEDMRRTTFELGQQIDATNTLLDTVGRAVGLDLFPDDPPPAPPAPEAKP